MARTLPTRSVGPFGRRRRTSVRTVRTVARSVDHEARRDEVAALATGLIARGGIDAATVRDIAAAGGYSTKIVSRYFSDKRELLLLVYRAAAERARHRLMAARIASGDDVLACTDALLPLDDERRADWAVWLAFWGMAVSDQGFSREQRRRSRSTRKFLAAVIENAVAAGDLPDETDADWMAAELLTAVHGVAVQALFDPLDWPVDRQQAMVRAHHDRVVR
jgi:AcrR family transcriptional regulator